MITAGQPSEAQQMPSKKGLFGEATPTEGPELLKIVEERVRATRTPAFDIFVGEILSIHERNELVVQPEFQRLFRWSIEEQ